MIKERDISDVALNERPLEGMKVLELGQILAGAFTTTILGYFGAEVNFAYFVFWLFCVLHFYVWH